MPCSDPFVPVWPRRRRALGIAAATALPLLVLSMPLPPIPWQEPKGPPAIQPVPFTAVRTADSFWSSRLERNRQVTIPHNIAESHATGRIANFRVAAHQQQGGMTGYFFNDSDVYKVLEGAGYAMATSPDPELMRKCDAIVDAIAAAQEPDGYLYTSRTILDPTNMPPGGRERWSDMANGHELYCAGHLYEAAVAYAEATGRTRLLDVALKNAALVIATFGPGRNPNPGGHPEIELGLLALYRHTHEAKYLEQAQWFVDARGRHEGRRLFGEYAQDLEPVLEQHAIVGHAVRACYLFAATTDVGRLRSDRRYVDASRRIWDDMASSQVYLTGGVGSQGSNEGFGARYQLPNLTGYGETCASIANALWSWRLFLATGEGRHLDMVERVLFNAFPSGWSLSGDRFFYPNPLESRGAEREPWFSCACCPPNVDRFVPQIPGMLYATGKGTLWVNLFAQSETTVPLDGDDVRVKVETRYPWHGDVRLHLRPRQPREFTVKVHVPGWACGEPLPGGLYRYASAPAQKPDSGITLSVNGDALAVHVVDGFVSIARRWQPDDVVSLDLPMPVHRVLCDERVEADRGKVALQRGPVVYCFEGLDQPDPHPAAFVLADDAPLRSEHRPDLLDGVTVVRTTVRTAGRTLAGGVAAGEPFAATAIPYYAWANRGRSPMAVWLGRTAAAASPMPAPTLARRAKASASFPGDLDPLSDQAEPENSDDHDHPHVHWWPKKGTTEWLQYELDAPAEVAGVRVYWFDDTGHGECRVPAAWKCLVRVDGSWREVQQPSGYGTGRDGWQSCTFTSVRCDAVKLEVTSQPKWAGGIHEWQLLEPGGR